MKKIVSLNGEWKLAYFNPGSGKDAYNSSYDDSKWLSAKVPGDIHLDLVRHGLLPDPYYHLNFREHYWVEEKEWWYRKKFSVKDSFVKAFLVFEGVDTLFTAWLNGVELGSHGNMFTVKRFNVTHILKGDNILAVRIFPVKNVFKGRDLRKVAPEKAFERLFTRKSQMSFGWDIAPRLVTVGIWRDVKLVLTDWAEILDIYVRPIFKNSECILRVILEISNYLLEAKEALIEVDIGEEENVKVSVKHDVKLLPGINSLTMDIKLDNVKYWWPWDKGYPHLYWVKVTIREDNSIIDCTRKSFGVRKVKLVLSENGRKVFYFKINGEKVYARGFNWTPPDSIFVRTSFKDYLKLLEMVKEANANMLRVWGGGIYPHEEFYDICDKLGIMIWQDFMFACGAYPRDHWFLMEAMEEAKHIVKRLRNHPSIVLWCGDNENDVIYHPEGHPLNRFTLREVCEKYDPDRPYWPSSPSGGKDPNDPSEGDTHIWHHGEPYASEIYKKELSEARFISEIGHLSCPSIETMSKFLPPDLIWPPNDLWKYHFGTVEDEFAWYGDPHRREKMENAIRSFWGEVPKNLEEYVYVSQLLQAIAYKYWVEESRINRLNGGILLWNVTDAWPQFSDSVIDYFRKPKLAYYFAKIAFNPLHVILKGEGVIKVYLVNDYRNEQYVTLTLEKVVYGRESQEVLKKDLKVEKGVNEVCEVSIRVEYPRREYLLAKVLRNGVEVSRNVYYFTHPKQLAFRYEEPLLGFVFKVD